MRAAVMTGFGSSDRISLSELPKPECRPEDLLVRVAAAGVNPTDWKEVEGHLTSFYPPYETRWAPGFDAAGVVEAIGSSVRNFHAGDRIMLLSDRRSGQCGTFAEYVRVDHRLAAHVPKRISLNDASSIPIAGLTAYQGLFREDMGALRAGQRVLIHGGSGGIGSFAIGLARAAGAQVIATCREVNNAYVRTLGAQHTIDYTRDAIAPDLRRFAPAGVDVLLDTTSGGTQRELLETLAPAGRWVVVATVTHDGDFPTLHQEVQRRGRSVQFLLLDHTTTATDLAAIARIVDRGMRMPAITSYPLHRASEALAAMRAGGTQGKLVIEIA